MQDGIFCHFVASMISGLVTTIASMPVDIAKTRLQNMKYIDGEKTKSSSSTRFSFNFCPGKPEYRGAGDVLSKVVKNEVSSKTNIIRVLTYAIKDQQKARNAF